MRNIRHLLITIPFTALAAIVFLMIMVNSAQAGCPGNMSAYWDLNETSGAIFADRINSNNATCVGTCPGYTSGRVNGALNFNGIDQGIYVPADASFNWSLADSFSIEFWMKTDPSSTCSGDEAIVGRAGDPDTPYWMVQCLSGGKAAFNLVDKNGNSGWILSNSVITGDIWHHIVAVRDAANSEIFLYIDGKLESSQFTNYSAGFDSTAPLSIGGLSLAPYSPFQGVIDEIALYNRALSVREIQSHFYVVRDYCDMCSTPVMIMPLGDSITDGYDASLPINTPDYRVAYRQKLYLDLIANGYNVNFVGSLKSGLLATPSFDIYHEGHPGWRTDQILNGNTSYPLEGKLSDWLAAYQPEIILLHIGTNDISSNNESAQEVAALLNEIDFYNEDITGILARIISRTDGKAQQTTDFNNAVEAMATSRIANGDKIIMVDQESALDYVDDMSGPLHPNILGYNKMADVWFSALQNITPYCGQTISAYPPSHDFAAVTVGAVPVVRTFTITNSGTFGSLSIDAISITGTDSGQFTVQGETCSGTPVQPSNSCTIDVAFSPTSVGSKSANLSIPSNDPQTPILDVPLSGAGTAPGITVTDSIVPDNDNNMAFPDTAKGTSSAEQTVTIGNSSSATATLNVSSIQITGMNAADFSLNLNGGSAPCGSTTLVINAGSSCTVGLTFSPQTTGAKSANLQIDSDDPNNGTVNVALSGAGTAPGITVSGPGAFPDTTEGQVSTAQRVTIGNTGTSTLNVSNIQITGTDASEFTLDPNGGTNPCGSTTPVINPGGNCTVGLTFSPQTTGAKSANLQITSDDPNNGTVNVALSGTGLSSIVNNAPTKPTLVSPANGQAGVDTTVDFIWTKSTDPDGDTVSYRLTYCEDSQLTIGCNTTVASVGGRRVLYAGTFGSGAGLLIFGIVFAGDVRRRRKVAAIAAVIMITGLLLVSCGGGGSSTTTPPTNQVTKQIMGLNTGSTYYWKVVADDGKGGTTDSAVWSYTTR